jgi:hypothetical protein
MKIKKSYLGFSATRCGGGFRTDLPGKFLVMSGLRFANC